MGSANEPTQSGTLDQILAQKQNVCLSPTVELAKTGNDLKTLCFGLSLAGVAFTV